MYNSNSGEKSEFSFSLQIDEDVREQELTRIKNFFTFYKLMNFQKYVYTAQYAQMDRVGQFTIGKSKA